MLFAIFTRSLPYIRRGYFVCNTNLSRPKKDETSPCYSHRHLFFQRLLNCPAIKFDKVWQSHALNYLFGEKPHYSLPLHAHSLTALKKGFPVCGGWSMPQHRHPVTKKAKKNGFFCSFGVFEATQNKY